MLPRDSRVRVEDMLAAIEKIAGYTANMTYEEFSHPANSTSSPVSD